MICVIEFIKTEQTTISITDKLKMKSFKNKKQKCFAVNYIIHLYLFAFIRYNMYLKIRIKLSLIKFFVAIKLLFVLNKYANIK